MKLFGITGVAGYIAPRHLKAIKDTGNRLIAALDPHDSVGILDSYWYHVDFFTEFERFDRHLERIKRDRDREGIDYLTICAPNYLHDAHIRLALRLGANAICEKPLVSNPWQLDALQELEQESEGKVFGVLQLRVHDAILALRRKVLNNPAKSKYEVDLTYITSRGNWYKYSWKGNETKSGGIAANIGIHFFDMLIWIFGPVVRSKVFLKEPNKMSGTLELENANVRWYLAIDRNDLPEKVKLAGHPTFRAVMVNGEEVEFSQGFTDLHTRLYEVVLEGKGFGMEDARPAIELVDQIQSAQIHSNREGVHPLLIK